MKFTVKWLSLLICITLSLKNPTMTRYHMTGLVLLPQALPVQTSAPNARDNGIPISQSCHVGWGGRSIMTAIIILATTANGRDHGSDVEWRITCRLLRIILTPNQFERMTGHHRESAPAVTCRNCPQGGLFCCISIGQQDAVHVRPAPPTLQQPDNATTC
jgi:hypothetical protein